MKLVRLCLFLALASPLMACINDDDGSGAERAYSEAKRQWEGRQVADYRYTVSIERPHPIFCFPPSDTFPGCGFYVVTVKDSVVDSAQRSGSGEALNEAQLGALATVDGLFSVIQTAIERPATGIDVEYDPQYGYPKSIFIDNSTGTADDETIFHASGLVPIAP